MYRMVENGTFTYFDLGVKPIYGGALPTHIVIEHQKLGTFFSEAYKEKGNK